MNRHIEPQFMGIYSAPRVMESFRIPMNRAIEPQFMGIYSPPRTSNSFRIPMNAAIRTQFMGDSFDKKLSHLLQPYRNVLQVESFKLNFGIKTSMIINDIQQTKCAGRACEKKI